MAPFYNINEFKTSLGALLPALFFAKILLGQFFGCAAPTEPVSTGAVTPIAHKKSAPSAIHASKNMT